MVDVTSDSAITAPLARWASELTVQSIPDEVRVHAAHLVLDGLGAGLYGASTPWGRLVGDVVAEAGGRSESTIWGYGVAVPAVQAPLANGTFMHSFEFDDLHPEAVLHGGAQVVPAALAVAGRRASGDPVTADELMVACVAGLEIGARIGITLGSEQLGRGFHPSPNTGLFSAAVTAGLLLRLNEQGLRDAFGIAGSSGGFLMAAQYGAMVKRMHPGRAAQAGVLAAVLAKRTFTGIDDVIEEPYGGFARAYAGLEPTDLADIVDGLGVTWETSRFGIKPYPCCGSNHTSIDALAEILEAHPNLTADDIDAIDIWCSTLTADHVGWDYQPRSVTAAQMNLPYTVAVQAIDRDVFVEQFAADRIARPDVLDLASRVQIHRDPAIDADGRAGRHQVRLRITCRDGEQHERTVRHALGSPHRPLPRHRVVEKYRRLARTGLSDEQVELLETSVLDLARGHPSSSSVRTLLDVLARARTNPPDVAATPIRDDPSTTKGPIEDDSHL